jgi:hypothetical protein
MGWAGASGIMNDVITTVMADDVIPVPSRKRLYRVLIDSLMDEDWDTTDESMGIDPEFDEVMHEVHREFAAKNNMTYDEVHGFNYK